MNKQFILGEVKSLKSADGSGEFEVILSAPVQDRDGEVIAAKAFEPLPETIPFHAFHDFHDPIGRATPFYDGDVLKARGFFASTPRAQEIRQLVADGVIGHTSVGFMPPEYDKDGTTIIKGELLEGSFVSVPSNREAAVLAVKQYVKSGRVLSSKNEGDLRQAVTLINNVLKQLSSGEEDAGKTVGGIVKSEVAVPVVDPDPAAADEAAAEDPAETSVEMARLMAMRAQIDLLFDELVVGSGS